MSIKHLLLISLLLSALSCQNKSNPGERTDDKYFYAKGADISWATRMEDSGQKFFASDGREMECTALFKEIGFNSVRFRVWVNPAEGYCNREDVLRKCLRAQTLGMKILIDFHYSDWWADPQQQNIPEAWKGLDADGLASAVADHTREVLQYLKDNSISVAWVQVGNEVRGGMLWEICRVEGTDAGNFVKCFNAGAQSVREVYPDAGVILHLDNAWNLSVLEWFYDLAGKSGAEYDMIGLSLYPSYWDSSIKAYPDWHIKTAQAIDNFKTLHERYHKDVMLVEFGMPVSLPGESKACLQRLLDSTKSSEWFKGIFLWEPESEKNRNNYDYGAFSQGKPTIALDPFNN